jgi:hypothetical protein
MSDVTEAINRLGDAEREAKSLRNTAATYTVRTKDLSLVLAELKRLQDVAEEMASMIADDPDDLVIVRMPEYEGWGATLYSGERHNITTKLADYLGQRHE